MKGRSTAADIAAAAREIFEADGAAGVTMRRVADAVGLTPMAIYRHFPTRLDLLNSVADTCFEALAAEWWTVRPRGSARARILQLLDGYLDFALRHPRLFDFMFSEHRKGARCYPGDFRARRSPTANLLADAVAAGIASGELAAADVWEVTLALWAHAHGLVALYRVGRFDLTPDRFRALYRRSLRRVFDGLAT